MITSFTKKILFSFLFLSFLLPSTLVKGQMLEEIPNPPGYTLNWFTGGSDGNLFFEYFDANFQTLIHHYDGTELNPVPLPPDAVFSFYSHEYNGLYYFISYDPNFNPEFYEYDGTTAEVLNVPAGYQFNNWVTNYDGNMYVSLVDASFTSVLFQYDGADFFEIPSPAGLQFNNYVATYDDIMLLNYVDASFNSQLYAFDGSSLTPVSGVPANSTWIFLAYEGEDILYIGIQGMTFQTALYVFNGSSFVEIPSPPNMQFNFIMGENVDAGEVYISYFDEFTFNSTLFIYNGLALVPIPVVPGYDFPNLADVHNGVTYISMFDNINFLGQLFKLEGGALEQVTAPAGYSYSFTAGPLLGEAHHLYYDANFNFNMMKLDDVDNSVSVITGPVGYTFNNYFTTVNDKMILSYYNAGFQTSLWIYDGTNFIEVPNPTNMLFSSFMVEDDGKIFLRYDDEFNFQGTLYVLTPNSLPTSIDNSVTTDVNIPYFFNSEDFFFADPDIDDVFSNILITEIEQVGYLLWDGAHVYEGDIIPVSEIGTLTFTPLQDEIGSPYDAFRFKVGDGDDFSDLDYIMEINVIDPTSTNNNELNNFTKIYPVPANDITTIEIESDKILGDVTLRIFSVSGQLIRQERFDGIGNYFRETINVSELAEGAYFIVGDSAAGQFAKPIQILR